MLEKYVELKIDTVMAILEEREKATEVMARNIVNTRTAEMERAFVLQEQHTKDISNVQGQISGPLGLELRMRSQEQSRGVMDAKLYLIIIGLPLAVSVTIAVIINIFLAHVFK
ncbi:hypothetical protein HWQ67_12350 [Candidatus Magnetobacterium casensis]|uniref:Uncharacterized protein n=2 Tax=Candidatus Magnetobacterium casense TaxID=1455061 RepID=A0ABS6S0J1_9BACT|nr:hypothetical protein [Candidatus Magnetobacterium casensis]